MNKLTLNEPAKTLNFFSDLEVISSHHETRLTAAEENIQGTS